MQPYRESRTMTAQLTSGEKTRHSGDLPGLMTSPDDTDGSPSAGSFGVFSPLKPYALSCWDSGLCRSKGYLATGTLAKLPAVGLSFRDAPKMGSCQE